VIFEVLKLLSKEIIESIKSKLNIVDVISEYVVLQRVGKNFRGLCPFHSEKTPSFYVSREKGLYHCFGCGASGDVIKFVQEIEGITFIDAVKKLADRAGIKLPEISSSRNEYYAKYVKLYTKLANIYHKNIFKQNELLNYLMNIRKIELSIIRKFKIGFCPPNSKSAYFEAKNLGVANSELRKFGLVNSKGIDFHNNRLVFPVYNDKGSVVAFGSRVVPNTITDLPKYINTPETPFFSKSKEFFCSTNAFDIAKEANFIILVEGYFDVLSLNVCGFENTVAPMGTSLSNDQIKKISKITKNVILFFDSDDAGKKATINLIPKLEENNLNIAIVNSREFKDASEILQRKNQEHLKKYIESAIGYEEFLVEEFSKSLNINNPASVEAFLEKIQPFALRMLEKRPVRYENLIKIINSKLGIRETISRTFFARSTEKTNQNSHVYKRIVPKNERKNEVDLLVKIFVEHKHLRKRVLEIMRNYKSDLDDFGVSFLELIEKEKFFSEDLIIEKLSEKYSNRFFKILIMDIEQTGLDKVLLDCEEKLRKKHILNEVNKIDEKLKTTEGEEKKSLLERRMVLLSYLKGGKNLWQKENPSKRDLKI